MAITLLAYDAGAQQSFDPNGTTSVGGSGFSWDTTNKYWTPNGTQTQVVSGSLVVFANGNEALFCAGPSASTSQGTFTNFVSGTVSPSEIILGNFNPGACNMTLNGPGTISLSAATTPFSIGGTGGSSFIVNCTIAGGSGNVLQIANNSSSTTSLFGSNTYSGGTQIDGAGAVNFNSSSSFGTGTITWLANGFIQASGSSAITITNAMTHLANGAETFAGLSSASVTFTSPWDVGTGTLQLENILGTITVAGPISDSANLTFTNKNAAWMLTGTNTFTGNLTIGGTLTIGGNGSLGSGSYGGTILVYTNLIYSSSVTQTLSGAISGAGGLTMNGPGTTLTLSGNNSYTGATVLSNGTLSVTTITDGGSSSIGGGPVTLGGGTLLYTGVGDTTSRLFKGVSGTTSTIDVPNGVTVTLDGQLSNSAAWTVDKVDTGTLVLGGPADNSFLGMNVQAGTVVLSKTTAGHAIGNPLNVASNATVQFGFSGYNAQIYNNVSSPVTISSGGVLDANGQTEIFYSLNLAGSGIGGTGALINSSGSAANLTCAVILNTNATIGGPGNITLGGALSGSGSLTYSGGAELSLAGSSAYSGGITVSSGLLDISPSGGSIGGTLTLNSGATLELDNPLALSPTAILAVPASPSSGIVNLSYTGVQIVSALFIGSTPVPVGIYDSVTNNPSGIITGTGLLSVGQIYWDASKTDASHGTNTFGGGAGSWDNTSSNWWVSGNSDTIWESNSLPIFAGSAGNVTLNASETASGLTFLTSGYNVTNTDGVSTLTLIGPSPTVTFPAGTTEMTCLLNAAGTNVGLTAMGTGTLLLTGNISGGGANGGLTVSGGGTVSLTGNNTYTNGTLITGNSTLSVNSISDSGTSAIGNSGNLTLTGGTLSYTGAAAASTARAVTASAGTTNAIDVPAGSLTLSGQVEGTNLSKTSSGTLYLGGVSNDNSGLDLAIQAGTVIISKTTYASAHGLGGGLSTVASNAELQLAGSGNYDLYSGCLLTVSNGGMFDVNGQSDNFSTLSLSGTGISNKGALINSAASTTSGLTNGGSGVVLQGPTTIGGAGNITLFSVVSGSSPLTYSGTGTLALYSINTYSGGTTVNSNGTLLLTAGSATNSSAGTGTITLNGNGALTLNMTNTEMNNVITGATNSLITINMGSGNLWFSNSPANQLNNFSGTFNVSSTSPTGGQLVIGTAALTETINPSATWQLNAGAVVDFNVGQTNPATVYLYGFPYTGAADGALRLDASVQSGPVILMGNTEIGNGYAGTSTISGAISSSGAYGFVKTGADPIVLTGTNTYTGYTTISNGSLTIGGSGSLGSGTYAGVITNNVALIYASSAAQTLSGVISGTGTLNETGPGKLTLGGVDTYTGATTISAGGTLAMASGASINNTPSVNIAAGATFDVSSNATFTSSATTTFYCNGTGTNVGSTAAMIKPGSSGTMTVGGPLVLGFTPTTFNGDTNHPALYAPQGSLDLAGSSTTVSNSAATPLGAGTYALVSVASRNLGLSSTNFSVTGTGLAAGTTASLALHSGNLNLVVANLVVQHPVINSFSISGGNLVLSGTNGPDNGTYTVLMTTNVALPLTNWTPITTNTFSGTGTFSVTNAVVSGSPHFFSIQIP